MPLIYNSLDSEHMPVQERVLKTVPGLCETLDYGTVQNVLLVKVAVRTASGEQQSLTCTDSFYKDSDPEHQSQHVGVFLGDGQDAR